MRSNEKVGSPFVAPTVVQKPLRLDVQDEVSERFPNLPGVVSVSHIGTHHNPPRDELSEVSRLFSYRSCTDVEGIIIARAYFERTSVQV